MVQTRCKETLRAKTIIMKIKQCTQCKIFKNIDEFRKNKSNKDGLDCNCKECRKQYYYNNKEKLNKKSKQYKINNKDKIDAYNAKYREDNREIMRERCRQYRKNNLNKEKKRIKKYCSEHKEQINAQRRSRYKSNKKIELQKRKIYQEKNQEKIKIQRQQYYQKNKKKISQKAKEYRSNNIEKFKKKDREQYLKHKEKIIARHKQYYQNNKEKLLKYQSKRNKEKYDNDYMFRLNHSISTNIFKSLQHTRHKKGKRHWETLIDYDIKILKSHLEQQFQKGMTWEKYGLLWHIDHIFPKSWFKFESYEDIDFKLCWDLNNLQPLWKIDNLNKHAKIKPLFQPKVINKLSIDFLNKLIDQSQSPKIVEITKQILKLKEQS